MDWETWTPIIISFAAFVVSAFTLYSNWNAKKFNIEIETVASYSNGGNGFIVRVILKNKSNQPITITDANIEKYRVKRDKQVLGSDQNKITLNSKLPLTFLAYEAKEINFYFPIKYSERESYKDAKNFEISTTRGIKEFEINLHETNRRLTALIDLEKNNL